MTAKRKAPLLAAAAQLGTPAQQKPTGRVDIPRKNLFAVQEAAELFALAIGVSVDAAKVRLYRAVQRGEIDARSHLGAVRIPYREVVRIIRGEEVVNGG